MATVKKTGSTSGGSINEFTATGSFSFPDESMPTPDLNGSRKTAVEEIMSMFPSVDGVATNSQYDIRFTDITRLFSNGIGTKTKMGSGELMKLLSQFCINVSIPYGQVLTSDIRHYGELFSIPADRSYGEAQMTFYMDNKGIIYEFFNQWIKMIYDSDKRLLKWYDQYTMDIDVFVTKKRYYTSENAEDSGVVNPYADPIIRVRYEKAYPLSINLSSLSGTDGRSPLQFDVQFKARRNKVFNEILKSDGDKLFSNDSVADSKIPSSSTRVNRMIESARENIVEYGVSALERFIHY